MSESVRDDDDGQPDRGEHSSSYTDGGRTQDLGATFAAIARQWDTTDDDDGDATLLAIASSAVDAIPGAEWASITEVRRRQQLSVRLATDDRARLGDTAQYELGEGPCLDAAYQHATVRVDDVEHDPRWPAFGRMAVGYGLRSMLALQLFVHEGDLGALNLYSGSVGAFDDESEDVGLVFAAHAAIAMQSSAQIGSLTRAVGSRDVIGMGKGILMERYKVTGSAAFSMLTKVSQQTNMKLVEVARRLTEDGDFAGPAPR